MNNHDRGRFGWTGSLPLFGGLALAYGIATDVLHLLNPMIFPGWTRIIPGFTASFPQLLQGLMRSLSLLLPAVAAAAVIGVALGLVIGMHPRAERVALPFLRAVNPIPSTILIPYAIAIMPGFWSSSAIIIFIGVLWPVVMNTLHGVAMLEHRWLDNARCLNLRGWRLLRTVVLPGAMPQILAGLNAGLIRSFLLLTVAEMIGARAGLGFFVQYYVDFARYDRVLAGILWLSAVVVVIMTVFDLIKRQMLYWTTKR